MADSSYRIGWLAAAAVVLLRVGIGVHFLSEGLDKLADPKPFSAPFFGAAKGPLARRVQGHGLGSGRPLSAVARPGHRPAGTSSATASSAHYRFDDEQTKQAASVLKDYTERLNNFLFANQDKIDEYFQRLDRRDNNAEDPTRHLASLQTHDAKINAELLKMRGELLPTIDGLWRDFENDLNAIANA